MEKSQGTQLVNACTEHCRVVQKDFMWTLSALEAVCHGADEWYLLSLAALKWMSCFWPWACIAATQQVDISVGASNSSGVCTKFHCTAQTSSAWACAVHSGKMKLLGYMITCYKYIKEGKGKWKLIPGLQKLFKLGDNVGTKSNRYKLATNRFRLEIWRQFQAIRAVKFWKVFQQEEEGQKASLLLR